jgi:hypothetical protein
VSFFGFWVDGFWIGFLLMMIAAVGWLMLLETRKPK